MTDVGAPRVPRIRRVARWLAPVLIAVVVAVVVYLIASPVRCDDQLCSVQLSDNGWLILGGNPEILEPPPPGRVLALPLAIAAGLASGYIVRRLVSRQASQSKGI